MSKNAVVKKESAAIVIPEFMRGEIGLGTEALSAADVEIPRVKLMQALSPELEQYNDVKQGDFFHTLAELNLGRKVRISPIYIDQRFILWRPRDSGGGILARADNGIHWSPPNVEFLVKLKGGQEVKWRTANTVMASGLDKWGSSNPSDPNSPPAATRMYTMVVTFADEPDLPPAVITMQRAAIKVARRFIGKLKITRAPSFGLIFTMESFKDKNAVGQDFFNYQFTRDGTVENEAIYKSNLEAYQFFKEQGVQVKDLESAQEDDIPEDGTTNAEGMPKI